MNASVKMLVVLTGVSFQIASARAATDSASLLREVAAARAKGGGKIVLQSGLYTFDAPWKLGPADRNLVFEAAPGAVPVVSAGRRIVKWTVGKDGWWRAPVPKGEEICQFYVNGQRRQRPFLPRQGYAFVRDGVEGHFRKEDESAYLYPQDWPTGENPGMEFCLFTNWKMLRAKVKAYDAATARITLDVPPMDNDFDQPNATRWYRFDNVKSAMGEPGDWYADPAAGELTYVPYPNETPATCETVAARFPQAVMIEGAENIVFRGIVFSHGADWVRSRKDFTFPQAAAHKTGTVQVEAAKGIRFEDCAFLHTGATGLVIRRGARNCAAVRCEFSDLGAGGVRIGDGYDYRPSDGLTAGCTVRNCLIEKGGRFEPAGTGVLICHASDNLISENTIEDLYYSGISLGWGWCLKETACRNIIEKNDIDRIGQRVISDLGGIYTLSRQSGTVLRNNRVRNVTRARYSAFGIYHDSGSAEITVTNNFVSGCDDSSWYVAVLSASNRVENNLFFDAARRQLAANTIAGKDAAPSHFSGNIVKWSTESFASLPGPKFFESENNAYVCEEAGLPLTKNVRGFVRCRTVEEAKAKIGFKTFPLEGWGWKGKRRFTAAMPPVPAVFFPAPPPRSEAPLHENFAACKAGDPWPRFTNSCEGKPATIRVVEDPQAVSGKCVEFTQSLHAWRPHVYRDITRVGGRQRISFRIKLEKGANTYFEVRDGQYHAEINGPLVSLTGGGKLRGRAGALTDLPADVWIRVGLEFDLGEKVTDHTYTIRVKLPGDEKPRVFAGIPISPRFTSIGWIGFMSGAHEGQKFRIDEFRLDEVDVPSPSPLARWTFEEGFDDSVDDADGKGYVMDLASGARLASGAFGKALFFDGTPNARAHFGPIVGMDGADRWTLSMRALWASKPQEDYPNLLTGQGWGDNGIMLSVAHGSVHLRLRGLVDGKMDETALPILKTVPLNEWKTLTVTFDRPNLTTYVDGAVVARSRWDAALAQRPGLEIGGWGNSKGHFNGLIDDFAFWARALPAEEVRALAADPKRSGATAWTLDRPAAAESVAVWTNDYSIIGFNRSGSIDRIVERVGGRQLVKAPTPFLRVRFADGREMAARRLRRLGGDRLVWTFPGGKDEVELSVKPFRSGLTFRVEKMNVKDAVRLEWGRVNPVCARWHGDVANMISDEASGVVLRAYDLKTDMAVKPCLSVADTAETGFVGRQAGLVAGPRKDLVAMTKDLTRESGAVNSALGGAGSTVEEGVRRSYMFADLSLATVDDWIDQALRGGISIIHFHAWWEWLGQYPVRKALFPNGLADMKAAADRVHAAGLFTGMHTLTACINPYRDPWIFPKCPADLVVDRSYTLAEPLTPDAKELVVNELPWDKHDLVFTYSGRGNALRLGHEIILYTGIRREKPYAFTGLQRGAFKTERNALAVAAGTKVDYLHQHYIAFYPLPDSALAEKLATNVATVYNTCGMDQIYFDGAEGMGTRYGTDAMRAKIVAKLDQSKHPVLVESSCGGTHNWWMRARLGTVDYPRWAPKRFHDHHIRSYVQYSRMGNLLEPQMGWWEPRRPTKEARGFYVDEMEYFGAKNAGIDAAMSFDGANVSKGPVDFWPERLITALGWYERFRMARAFAPGVKEMLAVPGDEYRLRQGEDGVWRLTKTDCHVHRVSGSAAKDWTVPSATDAKAALRVEALYDAEPYDSEKGTNVLTAADVAGLKTDAAAGVKVAFSTGNDPKVGATIRMTAANGGKTSVGAWARGRRVFAFPYANFGDRYAYGFWVKGDGSGALLNFQLEQPREYEPGLSEHYVKLDFTGWRYVALLVRERDAADFPNHVWPYGGLYLVYRNMFSPRHCSAVTLYLNDVPAGGKAEVEISAVRALPVTRPVLKNATVRLGSRAIAVPFGEMAAGTFAEWEDGFWTHYSEVGEPLQRVAAPDMPALAKGENPLSFLSEGRAEITVFAFGESREALADLTGEMRKGLAYEAPFSDWYQPTAGFADIAPVTVRPGETARLEVFLHDAVKNPTLTFPTWFGLSSESYVFPVEMKKGDRLVCRDGRHWIVFDKTRKTLAEGDLPEPLPTVKGTTRVKFSSADPSTAACRVGLVKRYPLCD